MSAAHKALIRRLYEEVFHQGKLALIDELFSPSYVRHDPTGSDVNGPEEVKHLCTVIRAAFPDIHYTLEDLVAEGDKVVVRWTACATHKGDFMGVAPTSKRVTLSGTVTFLMREDKIQEEWSHWDALGLLQQLGRSVQ